jgi:3-deoxy-D-manno-octulosonic-acid transferase
VPADARVVLGDSLGEMLAYYAAADVAFRRRQPAAVRRPESDRADRRGHADARRTATPSTSRKAAETAVAAGAALRVRDADEVFATAGRLLDDAAARERMRACGDAFLATHRGAVDRLWTWLAPRLAEADSSRR